ncbi:major facilitator superfamily domain-containing protein [Ilyonectria robusta]|uniref:major facilitator superfamily domain-containing protein n=1 Tax=Ilyonectria robusta TaxID=1079257 RepID=UPI001E8E8275|nr:major facilitator superfamily domain-containing protein [Ilyonectria robusta]KAH8736187.1 major facilitator superfamily domain-containing protein [Ilyonectria robusta]
MARLSETGQAPMPERPPQLDSPSTSSLRMALGVLGLWICLFLSALETTIVATALQTISDDLNGLAQSNWVVVAYLLTYNGFLLLFSKLTDIFGQKALLIVAQIIFLISSLACGAAQTMPQLIVFRAFQGLGGSGIYSTVFIIIAKIVTVDKVGTYTGILSSVFALASLLGPILGGAIVDNTTWRWVFFINGPGIVISLLLVIFAIPNSNQQFLGKDTIQRVDFIGGLISIAWPIMLVFALQEAGDGYSWGSSTIIGTLVGSGVGLVSFVVYELWVQGQPKTEPIFPIGLLRSITLSLNLITMFAMGACFYAAIILLPQRFQSVNGLSALNAGLNMLAFTLVSPVFSMACGIVLSKKPPAALVLLLAGSALTTVGMGLLSTLADSGSVSAPAYGYEVLLGVGLGLMMPSLIFLLKVEFDDENLAAVMGANNTTRTLGGCVALSVCSTVLHTDLHSKLAAFLTPEQITAVLGSSAAFGNLSDSEALRVRQAYGASYDTQCRAMLAFAGLGFVSALCLGLASKRLRDRIQAVGAGQEQG